MAVIVADCMPDVRAFLRGHPDLQPLHNGRVFFRIPTKQAQWPLLRIYRAGGAIMSAGGTANVSSVDISIEAWGTGTAYDPVRKLAAAVESALWTMPSGTRLAPAGGPTVALSAQVTNVIDSPDPDDGSPRLILDSRWMVQGL